MFFARGTATQIVIAMMIAFAALMVHMIVQAYKEMADSVLQTVSMICIFLTLWLGLLIRTGPIEDMDMPNNPVTTRIYEAISTIVAVLPVISCVGAILYKVGVVLSKSVLCDTEFLPDLGCGAAFRLCFGGGQSLAVSNDNALKLALAINTDALGNLLADGQKAKGRRSKAASDRKKTTRALQLETGVRKSWRTATHARLPASGEEKSERQRREAQIAAEVLEHAQLAREGKPIVKKDAKRKHFLLQMRIPSESVVMRHWPVGKGFLVRLPERDSEQFQDTSSSLSKERPPFLFVKVWRLTYEMKSGFVGVSYDLRDTGFRIEPESIIFYPAQPNRELMLWEAKLSLGLLNVSKACNAATVGLSLAAKLRRNKQGDAGGCKFGAALSKVSAASAAAASGDAERDELKDAEAAPEPSKGCAGRSPDGRRSGARLVESASAPPARANSTSTDGDAGSPRPEVCTTSVASVSAASKAFVAAQAADRHARRTPCHRRVGEAELRRSTTTEPVRSQSPGGEEASPEKSAHHHHRRKGTKHHRSREDRAAREANGMHEEEIAEPQRAPNTGDAALLAQMAARAAAEPVTGPVSPRWAGICRASALPEAPRLHAVAHDVASAGAGGSDDPKLTC